MIRIAICDDSRIERTILAQLLESLIKERSLECSITCFDSGEELLRKYEKEQFDLLFLDIIMSNLNGIDTGREIRKQDVKVEIIYCTSSMDFTLASYEVFALGYLLKPLAVEKLSALLDYFLQKQPDFTTKFLSIRSRYTDYIIYYKDLLYAESSDKVVSFHTVNQGVIQAYEKLMNIEEQLKDNRFLRCHQSYIVNLEHVIRAEATDFLMMNGELVPIRKRERKQIIEYYKNYAQERKM